MKFTHPPGSQPLAGYTIKRGIGRGAFGEVYFAVSDGGKEVALKLIQQHVEVELRGVRECLNLEHPNLVRLYDVQETPESESWVVMEYCDQENLEDDIAAHPNGMPIDKAMQWFRGICAGVGYLHSHDIVHRDLKPSHIFRENGVVKICDYGLAKFISVSRRSGNTDGVGTVHYAAPEMAQGKYGKELDLYSIGVMFHEALSGDVPFDGQTAAEILMKHLTQKPDVSAFSSPFRQTIARLLEKDPKRRFHTVEELMQTFDTPVTANSSTGGMSHVGSTFRYWITEKVQPRQRIAKLIEYAKQNKMAALAILGVPLVALVLGIAIGDANRRSSRPYYRNNPITSISNLSNVPVMRKDGPRSTVRLSEVATFRRVGAPLFNGRRNRYPAYEIMINNSRAKSAGVGNEEILLAMWDKGFSPMLQIDFDETRAKKHGIKIDHVHAVLQEYVSKNTARRRVCRFERNGGGFAIQYQKTRVSNTSSGIIDFQLLNPASVFDLKVDPRVGKSLTPVPLKDIATIRIIAFRSQ
jgi:serine/threonine protein kinase